MDKRAPLFLITAMMLVGISFVALFLLFPAHLIPFQIFLLIIIPCLCASLVFEWIGFQILRRNENKR